MRTLFYILACVTSLQGGELLVLNQSSSRVLISLDGNPLVSPTVPTKVNLDWIGGDGGNLTCELDMPDGSKFPTENLQLILDGNRIARLQHADGGLEPYVKKQFKVARVAAKNPNLAPLANDKIDAALIQINGVFSKKSETVTDARTRFERINPEVIKIWSNDGAFNLEAVASGDSLEVIRGERTFLLRVSEKSLQTGNFRDRSVIRYSNANGAGNLVESLTFSIDERSHKVMMLSEKGWIPFFKEASP